MASKRPTVREIAEIAQVSIATVSRVSRGTGQVRPELRQRVLRVIEEQGYRPNQLGRALAERKHGSIAIVFPGLSGPYFSELIQGFESEAMEAGTGVHIVGTHKRAAADGDVLAMSARVDGIAVHGGTVSYTFTAADAGVHTFTATLKTAGAQSITVTDAATATILGSRQYAMRVWLNLDRMRAYNVSADDIMKAVGEQSMIGSPGRLGCGHSRAHHSRGHRAWRWAAACSGEDAVAAGIPGVVGAR